MTAIPLVNPVMTGCGMNLIAVPSFATPMIDEQHAGHQRGDGESVDAVLLHDAVDDHDERAGRSADLHARAAERGDEEAGDDGGPQAAVRRHAAGDRERDRERQRDDADDDARGEVSRRTARGRSPFSVESSFGTSIARLVRSARAVAPAAAARPRPATRRATSGMMSTIVRSIPSGIAQPIVSHGTFGHMTTMMISRTMPNRNSPIIRPKNIAPEK